MPAVSSNAPGAHAFIGPPPKTISVMAISSFVLMAMTLYYLFFRFTFTYDYDGVLVIRGTSPQQLVVTIPKGQNLNGNRTRKWLVTVQPLKRGNIGVIQHTFGPRIGEIKNNSFLVRTYWPLSVQTDVPIPCRVRFTSAPLREKVL